MPNDCYITNISAAENLHSKLLSQSAAQERPWQKTLVYQLFLNQLIESRESVKPSVSRLV
jgi:hypothetical protein